MLRGSLAVSSRSFAQATVPFDASSLHADTAQAARWPAEQVERYRNLCEKYERFVRLVVLRSLNKQPAVKALGKPKTRAQAGMGQVCGDNHFDAESLDRALLKTGIPTSPSCTGLNKALLTGTLINGNSKLLSPRNLRRSKD